MSTMPDLAAARAAVPAERALFRGLFDDAAIFPPGLAPMPIAVAEHLARRRERWADLVGPLLVAAGAANDYLHTTREQPVDVAVVARPGTDPAVVADAVTRLAADPTTRLSGVELGWAAGWQRALEWGVPVAVEVPHGADQRAALGEIARETGTAAAVHTKLRTGATEHTAVPTPSALATFVRACIDLDLGFKLTGGLHHAVAHTTDAGEDQHGFLNVIAATRYALAHGAEVAELESLLRQRDPAPLVEVVTRMSEADASVLRAFFTAFGCCGVLDPIADLSALGLIEETV